MEEGVFTKMDGTTEADYTKQDIRSLNTLDPTGLQRNNLKEQNNTWKQKCEVCGREFRASRLLEKHRSTHNDILDPKATKSGKKTKKLTNIWRKQDLQSGVHKEKLKAPCVILKRESSMRISDSSDNGINDGGMEEGFQKDNGQMSQKSVEDGLICHVCGKSYSNKANLKHHLNIHLEEKRYKCSLCPKEYVTKQSFDEHQQRHAKEKLCQCEKCGRRYYNMRELMKHMKFHDQETEHKCEQCKMFFKDELSLLRHNAKAHTKLYPCQTCSSVFSNKRLLRSHQIKEHSDNLEKRQTMPQNKLANFRKVLCKLCGLVLSNKYRLQKHLVTKHGIDKDDVKGKEYLVNIDPDLGEAKNGKDDDDSADENHYLHFDAVDPEMVVDVNKNEDETIENDQLDIKAIEVHNENESDDKNYDVSSLENQSHEQKSENIVLIINEGSKVTVGSNMADALESICEVNEAITKTSGLSNRNLDEPMVLCMIDNQNEPLNSESTFTSTGGKVLLNQEHIECIAEESVVVKMECSDNLVYDLNDAAESEIEMNSDVPEKRSKAMITVSDVSISPSNTSDIVIKTISDTNGIVLNDNTDNVTNTVISNTATNVISSKVMTVGSCAEQNNQMSNETNSSENITYMVVSNDSNSESLSNVVSGKKNRCSANFPFNSDHTSKYRETPFQHFAYVVTQANLNPPVIESVTGNKDPEVTVNSLENTDVVFSNVMQANHTFHLPVAGSFESKTVKLVESERHDFQTKKSVLCNNISESKFEGQGSEFKLKNLARLLREGNSEPFQHMYPDVTKNEKTGSIFHKQNSPICENKNILRVAVESMDIGYSEPITVPNIVDAESDPLKTAVKCITVNLDGVTNAGESNVHGECIEQVEYINSNINETSELKTPQVTGNQNTAALAFTGHSAPGFVVYVGTDEDRGKDANIVQESRSESQLNSTGLNSNKDDIKYIIQNGTAVDNLVSDSEQHQMVDVDDTKATLHDVLPKSDSIEEFMRFEHILKSRISRLRHFSQYETFLDRMIRPLQYSRVRHRQRMGRKHKK